MPSNIFIRLTDELNCPKSYSHFYQIYTVGNLISMLGYVKRAYFACNVRPLIILLTPSRRPGMQLSPTNRPI